MKGGVLGMFRHFLTIIVCICISFIVSCATGPKYSEVSDKLPILDSQKGRIFFFRPNKRMGMSFNVQLNNDIVGRSSPGCVFFTDCPPGHYNVELLESYNKGSKILPVSIDKGETVFVRIELVYERTFTDSQHRGYSFRFYFNPKLVTLPEKADQEMANLKYFGAKN